MGVRWDEGRYDVWSAFDEASGRHVGQVDREAEGGAWVGWSARYWGEVGAYVATGRDRQLVGVLATVEEARAAVERRHRDASA